MKIFIANNPPQAHVLCGLLNSASVHAEVRGEGLFSLQGELPFGEDSSPYIWLLQPNKKIEAEAIINAFLSQSIETYQWQCTGCNEINDSQFAICWNCGQSENV